MTMYKVTKETVHTYGTEYYGDPSRNRVETEKSTKTRYYPTEDLANRYVRQVAKSAGVPVGDGYKTGDQVVYYEVDRGDEYEEYEEVDYTVGTVWVEAVK